MDNPKGQFEQPAGQPQKPSGPEVRIFTMPERYRHGAEGKQHEPERKIVQAPVEIKTPSVPPPPALPPKLVVPKKKRSGTKMILMIGVVVLLILGVGGYFLVRSVQPETTQEKVVVTPVVKPEPKPQPEPEPQREEPALTESDVFPVEVTPGTDSDSDGLSDTEENTVYKTDPRMPDTDSDGFLDGNEVFHRYNPAATGTLLEQGIVVVQMGTAGSVNYSFMFPAIWETSADGDVFVLDAQTGQGFRISTTSKDSEQTFETWVSNMTALEDPLEGTTKNGLPMLSSQNQLMTYVDLGSAVLVMEYDTGTKARVDYLQTMQMMLNSVEVVSQEE